MKTRNYDLWPIETKRNANKKTEQKRALKWWAHKMCSLSVQNWINWKQQYSDTKNMFFFLFQVKENRTTMCLFWICYVLHMPDSCQPVSDCIDMALRAFRFHFHIGWVTCARAHLGSSSSLTQNRAGSVFTIKCSYTYTWIYMEIFNRAINFCTYCLFQKE